MVRRLCQCALALTQKQTLKACGALERGHCAPLEPLAQLGDALNGVGALAMDTAMYILAEAAELVVGQADSTGMWGPSTGADRKGERTLSGGGAL